MKTCQQSLHDEGGQSRAGEEGDAMKLDDVRVAYGAQQFALLHELARGFGHFVRPMMSHRYHVTRSRERRRGK